MTFDRLIVFIDPPLFQPEKTLPLPMRPTRSGPRLAAPHSIWLLCASRERLSDCRATE
jgi:hypothetical protein